MERTVLMTTHAALAPFAYAPTAPAAPPACWKKRGKNVRSVRVRISTEM